MVRAKVAKDAFSWAWRCGDGEAESANWSKSFRIDVDCRKALLKSAFCLRRKFVLSNMSRRRTIADRQGLCLFEVIAVLQYRFEVKCEVCYGERLL